MLIVLSCNCSARSLAACAGGLKAAAGKLQAAQKEEEEVGQGDMIKSENGSNSHLAATPSDSLSDPRSTQSTCRNHAKCHSVFVISVISSLPKLARAICSTATFPRDLPSETLALVRSTYLSPSHPAMSPNSDIAEAQGNAFAGADFASVPATGFSVSVRSTPGKPRGFVEWHASCKHGEFKMDRLSKLVQLFEQHGKCR